MSHQESLVKQWKLLRELAGSHPRPVLGSTLAHITGPKSLEDEIGKLQARGYPITSQTVDGTSFFHFTDGYPAQLNLSLTHSELMALWFFQDVLDLFKGSDIYDDIYTVREKMRKHLTASQVKFLEELNGGVPLGVFPTVDYTRFKDTLTTIENCIAQKKMIHFKYGGKFDRRTRPRVCEPYQVLYWDHSLYVIGRDPEVKKYRWFLVHRMTEVEKMNETFARDKSYEINDIIRARRNETDGQSSVVHLKISGSLMSALGDSPVHPSQKMVHNSDYTADLYLKVPETPELVAWILSLGSQCIVVSPTTLTSRIAEEIDTMHRRYGDSPTRKYGVGE